MAKFWRHKHVPHKGWLLLDVIDIREDGQPERETDYETCMMCGNEKIRYVHVLKHTDVNEEYRVGHTCAEKMTNDYINPERRERELRNRASRRINWIKKQWKSSKNGNFFLNIDEHHLLIYRDKLTKQYKVKIGDTFGKKMFKTLEEAKIAVFKRIEYLKEHGNW